MSVLCIYMDFNFDIKNDLVFTTDKNGTLKGGGFVINSDLLKDTINNNNNVRGDTSNHITDEQSGGNIISDSVSQNVSNIFKDLAVPAGLFFTQKQIQKNNTIRYEHKEDVMSEGIYDKLLNLLEPSKRKLHVRKTKHNRENKSKKHTRKSSK